jgi:hypothetical protein
VGKKIGDKGYEDGAICSVRPALTANKWSDHGFQSEAQAQTELAKSRIANRSHSRAEMSFSNRTRNLRKLAEL